METGLVGGVPRPLQLHPTEGADRDVAVGLAAPRASPMLQLKQFLGCVLHEHLDGVLVGQPVGPRDRVVGVIFQRIGRGDDGGGPAFGRDRMAPHRVYLRDHSDAEIGMIPSYGDSGAEPRSTAPDDQDIMLEGFHAHQASTLAGNLHGRALGGVEQMRPNPLQAHQRASSVGNPAHRDRRSAPGVRPLELVPRVLGAGRQPRSDRPLNSSRETAPVEDADRTTMWSSRPAGTTDQSLGKSPVVTNRAAFFIHRRFRAKAASKLVERGRFERAFAYDLPSVSESAS